MTAPISSNALIATSFRSFIGRCSATLLLTLVSATAAQAATWYVKADAVCPCDGTFAAPLNTLVDVDVVSGVNDTIYVLPSSGVLDGGIRLKDGQQLIGIGSAPVTHIADNAPHAKISNTTTYLDGDGVRLENTSNNVVENIHIVGAKRAGVGGVNARSATIRNVLVTQNNLSNIPLPASVNAFGGISLIATASNDSGTTIIEGNVIRDSNGTGITLQSIMGSTRNYIVRNNTVRDLHRNYSVAPTSTWRATGYLLQVLNDSVITANMSHNVADNLAPSEVAGVNVSDRFVTDGLAIIANGTRGRITADVVDFVFRNPTRSGNAASEGIQISNFSGLANTVSVNVTNADILESAFSGILVSNSGPGVVDVTIRNSAVQSVAWPTASCIVASIGNGPGVTNLTIENTKMSDGNFGLLWSKSGSISATANLKVENNKFFKQRSGGVMIRNTGVLAANAAKLDFGGGPLGSLGKNLFVNDPTNAAYVDMTIASTATSPLVAHAENNRWSGAPIVNIDCDASPTPPTCIISDPEWPHGEE